MGAFQASDRIAHTAAGSVCDCVSVALSVLPLLALPQSLVSFLQLLGQLGRSLRLRLLGPLLLVPKQQHLRPRLLLLAQALGVGSVAQTQRLVRLEPLGRRNLAPRLIRILLPVLPPHRATALRALSRRRRCRIAPAAAAALSTLALAAALALATRTFAGALANAPAFAAALAGTLATALDAATAAAADSTADHLSPAALVATSWRACRLDASAATRLASCSAGLFFLSFAVL
mmetsp:Transcript_19870/g.58466  ORF Transcript_19870/g.58466 Transcript_19870/m.58466 type:complete len:233 (+) Transcript_19870:263-961(+)